MESQKEILLGGLKHRHSFKRVNKSKTNLDVSTSQGQINLSSIIDWEIQTWQKLVQIHCPQIKEVFRFEQYQKQYSQNVILIDTEIKFQNSNSQPFRYMLIKSKQQVQRFKKNFFKKFHKYHPQIALEDDIYEILQDISHKNQKEQLMFEDFIEQVVPHHKWDIRILGQYKVYNIEEGYIRNLMNKTLLSPCQKINRYYLTITDQCILYSDQRLIDGVVEDMIPYTYALKISYEQTCMNAFVVKIVSGRTEITAAFQDLHDLIKFAYTVNLIRQSKHYYFKLDQDIKSFSPARANNSIKFYCGGSQYFADLHDQIEKATKKICITGWCITPYFILKRPQNIQTGQSRLDKTLDRAAKRGVKIFILVFQEPSFLLSNDSSNVWETFENMNENFKVLRHPSLVIPQLWSHHEKCVIIDQKIGFMGGLDICYGRWDIPDHPLNDQNNLWSGADYNNERQRAITEPRRYMESNLDRESQPRMPWQDIALQVKGPAVVDMQRHFCQYWYFAIHDLTDDVKDQIINLKLRYDQLKRQKQQQNHQKQFYNKTTLSEQEMKNISLHYANEKIKEREENENFSFIDKIMNVSKAIKDLIQNQQAQTSKQLIVQGFKASEKSKEGNMILRLCRSSSTWSTGIETTQRSIYNAYLRLMKGAENFIYIENQFFMSYQNLISETIAAKIIEAHSKGNKAFKVMVMMPLLPGFQGDPRDINAGLLRGQMQLQYEAISRHEDSIFRIVKKTNPQINLEDYIYFFGLRNHGLFGKQKTPKTQIIYVHSKLMIVDDKYMIIGSANINDRSLLGNRDSQLAMAIQNPNGGYGQGEIFDFRCKIFGEHFGLSVSQCKNLRGNWKNLIKYAKKNTDIYRKIFGCYPDNKAKNFGDIQELQNQANIELYHQLIHDLKGHYVQWPVNFLANEDLSLKFPQKEYLLPKTFLT